MKRLLLAAALASFVATVFIGSSHDKSGLDYRPNYAPVTKEEPAPAEKSAKKLENAGFLSVYLEVCPVSTQEKRDIYTVIVAQSIFQFGKEAVEQAAHEQYYKTVYKQGAASFCKTAGWFLN
jgi:hypothetical protein